MTSPSGRSSTVAPARRSSPAIAASRSLSLRRRCATLRIAVVPRAKGASAASVGTWSGMSERSASSARSSPRATRTPPSAASTRAPISREQLEEAAVALARVEPHAADQDLAAGERRRRRRIGGGREVGLDLDRPPASALGRSARGPGSAARPRRPARGSGRPSGRRRAPRPAPRPRSRSAPARAGRRAAGPRGTGSTRRRRAARPPASEPPWTTSGACPGSPSQSISAPSSASASASGPTGRSRRRGVPSSGHSPGTRREQRDQEAEERAGVAAEELGARRIAARGGDAHAPAAALDPEAERRERGHEQPGVLGVERPHELDRPPRQQRQRVGAVGQALRAGRVRDAAHLAARGHRHALRRSPPRARHSRSRRPAAARGAARRGRRRARCG